MAVFSVSGYLIEERRRWPVITASPRYNIPNKFRILKERHIQMRKPYQLPGWTKNSSYYSAPVGARTHDLLELGRYRSIKALYSISIKLSKCKSIDGRPDGSFLMLFIDTGANSFFAFSIQF